MERLQKIIAQAGICSRRKAEELITQGRVSVNGKVITELGFKAEISDRITVDSKPIFKKEKLVYLVLNKPRNTVATAKDDRGRKTVLDKNVLLRYRELGGEIISLGSDSHRPDNVAEDFTEHAAILKSLGFRWSSHYEKRQLIQLPL